VFFIALHGQFGEDGRLQQILEDRGLAYTGSGSEASRIAFDKLDSKQAFAEAGIDVPPAIEFRAEADEAQIELQLQQMADAYVVKPRRQGSSVGISIVRTAQQAIAAAQKTYAQFHECIIEGFIAGREVTVGIVQDRALPIIEVVSKTGFYDYQAKYLDKQTEHLFDTIDDPALAAKIQLAALTCFHTLGCRHFARVDFILSEDNIPYALELNTIPGFTTHSLLPKAAAKVSMSMSHLCLELVKTAYAGKRQESGAASPGATSWR
jgi:D-alanine-D-alanine ligase